jgi:crotonobetainyl-CoA:carnitine CoA-transferase CaiB-like acyl-CoA transferase
MGYPVRFSETPAQIRSEAPEFGQHTEEILQELDLDWDKITELRENNVI